ncbi:MAG: MASE3 domain-containing protein [Desulfobacteraceae bacterium]|jgi:PAS domain S-box-containing protein
MNDRNFDFILYSATGALILVCFSILYLNNFLLFHSFAELFSIIVGVSIFVVAWNSRKFIDNEYIIFLGVAFFYISIVDLLHMLSYHGMPFFQQHGIDLPTQLWIAARYMQAITLVFAPFVLKHKININIIFTCFLFATALIIFLIFRDIFPVCYVDGIGLTPFKKVSEYIISTILLCSIILLLRHRKAFDRIVLVMIIWSVVFTILAELCFTLYISVYSFSNFAGHFMKIVSFLLLYRAIIVTGLKKPYSLLFREINQSREEYHSLFENMIDGFARHRIITDEKGRPKDFVFIEVNNAFEKLTGLEEATIIGRKVTEVLPGIENNPADLIGKYGEVALTGESKRFENYFAELKKWFEVAVYSTKKYTFATIFQDITERKQIEQTLEMKVKERTEELERRNQELQDFSFIASHDLREPLRKIRTFGGMISEKINSGSCEQVGDYISRMQNSVERMQGLISSLLDYSRVNTTEKPFDKIDLSMALVEAMSNLEILIKEKKAGIEVTALPTVEADFNQMIQLFQNLIGNALKFHKQGEVPCVRIYENKVNGSGCQIVVEDRGIGFDEKYLAKVFIPFQRLHGRSEYKGMGMGLAICKKIVERHGGNLTARSETGKGASFIFTLPVTHMNK